MNKSVFKLALLFLLPLTALTLFTAQAQNTAYSRSGRNGVWFEVRNDTSNPCRYTEDNKIYQADREFTFEFHYFDPQGKERYMRYERVPIQIKVAIIHVWHRGERTEFMDASQ